MNRKKSIITIAVIAVVALIGMLVRQVAFAKDEPVYRFAPVAKGDMKATVSATGTLSAVTTISVGTQVSGQVSELRVDFNDRVKKGELLARIDPTLAMQGVTDAQANLEKAQATAVQASRDFSRNHELLDSGLVARSAYEQTQSSAEVAQAGVKSARVALDRARQNLSYTNIYSPIDGVVVEKNVQQGQTVAASLSAPQLFLIANDLSQMQILAQVGESDIAQIKEGQPVDFTVQALANQTFHGSVKQVRLQSTTQDNVVNYTVVVAVDNSQGKLLPGMTARVSFLTKSAENVLKVPNAALRFRPPTTAAKTTGTSTSTTGTNAQQQRGSRSGAQRGGSVYVVDAKGTPQRIRVQTGITDGTMTEVRGDELKEGMKVIIGSVGASTPQTASNGSSATPFQGQQGGGAGRQRGGF
ncbi:MAG TPA: efflux RND transporter periplasmic adaptor subunit [Thermoanaerobaculia bacterium]|nr:efflux RND transporter periplasmic adaptor subunit [Thermoanaerobaculia bacterium]